MKISQKSFNKFVAFVDRHFEHIHADDYHADGKYWAFNYDASILISFCGGKVFITMFNGDNHTNEIIRCYKDLWHFQKLFKAMMA